MRCQLLLCLLVAALCSVSGYRSSQNVLENIKKVYPNRNYVPLNADDFEKYIAIAPGNGTGFYHIAMLRRNESFQEVAKQTKYPYIEAQPNALVFFPSKESNEKFGDILYEIADSKELKTYNTATGEVCAYKLNWENMTYRPHVYVMGKYMSIGPEDVVRLDNLHCGDQDAPIIRFDDIPPNEISKDIGDMKKVCWDLEKDDQYCVDDLDADKTILVKRRNPIYHTKDATIYAFCCDANQNCDKPELNPRCSYFIYDHASGVDYYIDDQMAWTTDSEKKPVFLIPAIDKNDKFNRRRKNFTTLAPSTSSTKPQTPFTISLKTKPPCNPCSPFGFFFGGFFG
ncbi:unnamed protein product [Bursaphelenchus xylophilus]|uniref:(pine wood nematode) hypothetical protein n=1 Tax=Bursaphelenchus xylophilus TaxID=6326 RepID=A0A1I7SAY6_BURXY|nr:unnamed protein product [Bursaphelenchus xylophilus]CAG9106040.1 unnamed protein product [Bursaphelenchus xylophilus]